MQITLKQSELEVAVRDYVAKMGVTRPVEDINFTVSRTPTTRISAEINIDDIPVSQPQPKPAPEVVKEVTEPVSEKPVKRANPVKPVLPEGTEAKAEDETKPAATKSPFEASNDDAEPEEEPVDAKKSLFA